MYDKSDYNKLPTALRGSRASAAVAAAAEGGEQGGVEPAVQSGSLRQTISRIAHRARVGLDSFRNDAGRGRRADSPPPQLPLFAFQRDDGEEESEGEDKKKEEDKKKRK